MGPTSPETTGINQTVTTLASRVTEIPYSREITVKAENVGTEKWGEMLEWEDRGKEATMNVFRNIITGRFTCGSIEEGQERGIKEGHDIPIVMSGVNPIRDLISDPIIEAHTHPLNGSESHIKTSIPSGNDLRRFLSRSYGAAMLILDRGGAHLLIQTREFYPRNPQSFESVIRKGSKRRPLQHERREGEAMEEDLPPDDLVQKKIDEVAARGGVAADVQKELNGMIAKYGLRYLYTEQLTPDADGTITFKTP